MESSSRRSDIVADSALRDLVAREYEKNRLVPVPGKPGRVYWPVSILKRRRDDSGRSVSYREVVGVKETTVDRAESWLRIAAAGKAATPALRQAARLESPPTPSRSPALPLVPAREVEVEEDFLPIAVNNPKSVEAKERPMSFDSDDDYFRYQYSKGPYGGTQSIPASRRNPRGVPGSGKPRQKKTNMTAKQWQDTFAAIGRRTSEIVRSKPECSWKLAFDQARSEILGGAKPNPWYEDGLYLPDTTQVRSVLERAPYNWSDETMVVSALEGGRYAKNNGGAAEAMRLYHSGQASSLKEAWAMVKGARHNPYDETPYLEGPYSQDHHPVYDQFIGQFGTSEAFTHGIVPYGRRNSGRKGR